MKHKIIPFVGILNVSVIVAYFLLFFLVPYESLLKIINAYIFISGLIFATFYIICRISKSKVLEYSFYFTTPIFIIIVLGGLIHYISKSSVPFLYVLSYKSLLVIVISIFLFLDSLFSGKSLEEKRSLVLDDIKPGIYILCLGPVFINIGLFIRGGLKHSLSPFGDVPFLWKLFWWYGLFLITVIFALNLFLCKKKRKYDFITAIVILIWAIAVWGLFEYSEVYVHYFFSNVFVYLCNIACITILALFLLTHNYFLEHPFNQQKFILYKLGIYTYIFCIFLIFIIKTMGLFPATMRDFLTLVKNVGSVQLTILMLTFFWAFIWDVVKKILRLG